MIAVFRCSARNWLLFVVQPPAAFAVSHCVCVFVFFVHLQVCVFACIHVGSCVCVCVCVCMKRSGYFVPPQMCQCSVWSPARLFHVIVPPTVCALPASRLISALHPLCPTNLPSLSLSLSPSFPPSLTLSFCLHLFLLSALAWFRSINAGYQDVKIFWMCFQPIKLLNMYTLSSTDHEFVVYLRTSFNFTAHHRLDAWHRDSQHVTVSTLFDTKDVSRCYFEMIDVLLDGAFEGGWPEEAHAP